MTLQKLILFTGLLLAVVSSGPTCLAQETKKLTPDEVIASHLDSIASAEARSAFKSLVAQGTVEVTIRVGGGGKGKGGAVMASQGPMSLIGFIFGQDASNEKLAFNGKKLTLGVLRPGLRSPFSAWPFFDANERKGKLRSLGTKNLKDRKAYVLGYEPRNSGNLDIKLYFDAETFQHLRTDYQQEFVAPTVTNPDKAARQKGTRFKITEEFSDFRREVSVTLPHTYKIQFTIETENHPLLQDWVVTLNQFVLNKTLDAKQFDLTAP
jgi:hypothetical protein